MKLLLDTHIFLWWLNIDKKLTEINRMIISDNHNDVFISVVSLWEISIKKVLNKIKVEEDLQKQILINQFIELPIYSPHAKQTEKLPLHHRDPFDRMLIAQAQVEGLSIITSDRFFDLYDVAIIK